MDEIEYLETEHGTFTNNELTGQTAEEVYQNVLNRINNPQQEPDQIGILQQQVKQLTEEKLILAQNVLDLTSVVEAIVLGGTA